MSRKIIGTIILVVGFLLLSGLIYGFFLHQDFFSSFLNKSDENIYVPESHQEVKDVQKEQKIEEKKEVKTVKIINTENKQDNNKDTSSSIFRSAKDDLSKLSISFAERFGSYSNQSDYSNLKHLMIFMSEDMKEWALDFIEQSKKNKGSSDIYYGISTKVVATEIISFDEDLGDAKFLVHTRRKESRADENEQKDTFSQDIELSFIKEDGVWKVNSAHWK